MPGHVPTNMAKQTVQQCVMDRRQTNNNKNAKSQRVTDLPKNHMANPQLPTVKRFHLRNRRFKVRLASRHKKSLKADEPADSRNPEAKDAKLMQEQAQ